MCLDDLKIIKGNCYNFPNTAFWGWLSMESQPQNPEFRINPVKLSPMHSALNRDLRTSGWSSTQQTLIRLSVSPGWSESLLGAPVIKNWPILVFKGCYLALSLNTYICGIIIAPSSVSHFSSHCIVKVVTISLAVELTLIINWNKNQHFLHTG